MALQIWLPLDNSTENQGLNGDIQNFSLNGLIQNTSGKIGKCYSGNAIYHLSNEFLSNEWSLTLWVKATAWGANNDILLCKNSNTSTACQFYFSIINGKSLNLGINGGSTTTSYSYTFSTDTWYHLVATYNGSEYALYINGNQVKTGAHISNQLTGHLNLSIGCRSTNAGGTGQTGYTATKYYNDVRIYDHCLSAKEVKELSKGLILHYPMNDYWRCENILTNSSGYQGTTNWGGLVTVGEENGYKFLIAKRTNTTSTSRTFCTHTALTSLVSSWLPGEKFTISGWYKVPSSETQQTGGNMFIRWAQSSSSNTDTDTGFTSVTNITDTWIRFENTYTVPPNFSSGKAANFYLSAFAAQKIATVYWKEIKIEKGDKATPWCPAITDTLYTALGYNSTTELDCAPAGNQNDGTIVGTITATADSPRYETSYYWGTSGTNYIKHTNFQYEDTKWTVSLWYKYKTMPSAYQGLFCFSKGNGADANKKMALMPNNNYIWFKAETSSGQISGITLNQWTHIVLVSEGNKVITYVNGVKKNEATISGSMTECHDLVIGARASAAGATSITTQLKDCNISDFRIYCTALSTDDIKELYNTAAQIDKSGNTYAYEFKEA